MQTVEMNPPRSGEPPSLYPLGRGGGATILFASTFIIMVGCVVAPGLPVIASHLGMEHHSGWLVTLPALGVVLFGPVAGWLSRRGVTARAAMLSGLFVYGTLGVVAPVLAHWPLVVIADRVLLGCATAIVLSSSLDLIASFFYGPPRLKMIALQGMATEGGGIVLLAVGGLLGGINWQLPFLLYGLAFPCFVCVLLFIPQPPAMKGEQAGVSHSQTSRLGTVFLSATLSMMLFFIAVLTLPGNLASAMSMSTANVGYVLSYISLCSVLWISVLPRALRYLRPGLLQSLAFLLYAAAYFSFAASRTVPFLLFAGALMGSAFAFSIPLASHLVVELSPVTDRARNLGLLSTCIFLGQVLSSFAGYISPDGRSVLVFVGCAGVLLASLSWIRELTAPKLETAI